MCSYCVLVGVGEIVTVMLWVGLLMLKRELLSRPIGEVGSLIATSQGLLAMTAHGGRQSVAR